MKKRFLSLFIILALAASSLSQLPVVAETRQEADLSYTDVREDYAALSDAQFANFRTVSTSGMGENILYRSASPINPQHQRNQYADEELKKAGVTVVMNLTDSREAAEAFPNFADSYYAGCRKVYVRMDEEVTSDAFRDKLGEGFRYFANHHGIYAIHCEDGIERTGFAAAILECFMGATAQEVISDYMLSYDNYYGISPSEEEYQRIAEDTIVKALTQVFGLDHLSEAKLSESAEAYMKKAGLSDAELAVLRLNLRGENHSPLLKNKKAATYKSEGYSGDSYCKLCKKLIKKGSAISKLKSKSQTIKVSEKASKRVIIKYKSIRKKSISFKISARAKGKIRYEVTRGKKKYISVSKSGKVKIKKKAKKGKYEITVYAEATSDGKYKKAQKVIKIRIK